MTRRPHRIVSAVTRVAALPLLLVFAAPTVAVETLQVMALTRDRVILSIDGARRVLRAGEESPEGVRLVEATSGHAVVSIDGVEHRLEPGPVTRPVGVGPDDASDGRGKVVLWADSRGFFHAEGRINGRPVEFLVDTGATTVALSGRDARALGLDLTEGTRGIAQTASGLVGMTAVTLDEVSVGSITLYNVEAGVIEGNHPSVPLLGASFLNQVDMQRAGQRMELTRK